MSIDPRLLQKTQRTRIRSLTTGPVLATLAGTRKRLSLLDWPELAMLCEHFGCEVGELEYRMWTSKRNRRRQPAKTRLVPQYALFRRART